MEMCRLTFRNCSCGPLLLPAVAFVDCGVLAGVDNEYDFFVSYVLGRFGVSGTSGVPPERSTRYMMFVLCLLLFLCFLFVCYFIAFSIFLT